MGSETRIGRIYLNGGLETTQTFIGDPVLNPFGGRGRGGTASFEMEEIVRCFPSVWRRLPSVIRFSIHSGTVSLEKGEIVRCFRSETLHFRNLSNRVKDCPSNLASIFSQTALI
jgi:hypothetical protein